MSNRIKLLLNLLFVFATFKSVAQSSLILKDDFKKTDTVNFKKDEERILKNADLIKNLVNALKKNKSFDYDLDLDTANNISVLKSSDNKLKIFSWYLLMSDNSYRFYGCIQIATEDGKLKLFPLLDVGNNLKDKNGVTSNKNWFGAKYYDIITLNNVYILIGWKGNNEKTSKKVIDVLWFDNDEVMFGKNIFSDASKKNLKNRIIFEYNKQNAMTLQYDKLLKTIVFDHLAPVEESKKGDYEFYVSDGSFDGYKITTESKLKFMENLILNNPIEGEINNFENPKLKKPIINKKTN